MADKKISCPGCKKIFIIPSSRFKSPAPKSAARTSPSSSPISSPSLSPVMAGNSTPVELDVTPSSLDLEIGLSENSLLNDLAQTETAASTLDLSDPEPVTRKDPLAEMPTEPGPVCPSCNKTLPSKAKICVECGINITTRKRLLMSDDSRVDDAYIRTEQALQVVSWILWMGLFPVASEAFGTKKPRAAHIIAGVTILVSVIFGIYQYTNSPTMRSLKSLMLWGGDLAAEPEKIPFFFAVTPFGDSDAYDQKLEELIHRNKRAESAAAPDHNEAVKEAVADTDDEADAESATAEDSDEKEESETDSTGDTQVKPGSSSVEAEGSDEIPEDEDAALSNQQLLTAYEALTPEQQCFGRFHWYQLITYALLHGGIMHLAGNLIFLFVFGSRVNALIGNLYTAILYPILAVIAGIAHQISVRSDPPMPMLGASGAIMGLAGMYLVFFPVNKVHMAFWLRLGLLYRFRLFLKLFALRGFWVVLFYIASDVIFTSLQMKDNVAHWAHLGGFIAGVVFALALLFARQVNARGGDMVSVLLGRRAWALVGKPK
jgi:membrane associated rhomboid family serine protease